MLRLSLLCLAPGLAASAVAPPPVLDMRPENPASATAPEHMWAVTPDTATPNPSVSVKVATAGDPANPPIEEPMEGMEHDHGGAGHGPSG